MQTITSTTIARQNIPSPVQDSKKVTPFINWCKIITARGWGFVPSFSNALNYYRTFLESFIRNVSPHYAHSLNDSITIKKKNAKNQNKRKVRSSLLTWFYIQLFDCTSNSFLDSFFPLMQHLSDFNGT